MCAQTINDVDEQLAPTTRLQSFDHVANLEAARRNRIRHPDEVRRGQTFSLDRVSLFDFLYVRTVDEGPTYYTVLDQRQMSQIHRGKSTAKGKYLRHGASPQAVWPQYLAYPRNHAM